MNKKTVLTEEKAKRLFDELSKLRSRTSKVALTFNEVKTKEVIVTEGIHLLGTAQHAARAGYYGLYDVNGRISKIHRILSGEKRTPKVEDVKIVGRAGAASALVYIGSAINLFEYVVMLCKETADFIEDDDAPVNPTQEQTTRKYADVFRKQAESIEAILQEMYAIARRYFEDGNSDGDESDSKLEA